MKYINFKKYYFFTIKKKINIIKYNFKKYYFFKIRKKIDIIKYNFKKYYFFKIRKKIDSMKYNFLYSSKFFKANLKKFYRLFDLRKYNFYKINIKFNFKYNKYLPIYFLSGILVLGFFYISIPFFYSYDKSKIENTLCKNKDIECQIMGKINYSFFPTPRIKISDLKVKDFFDKKNTIISSKNVSVILSYKNLLSKKKQNFKKIELTNFEINFELKDIKKYKRIFTKRINFIPIFFNKGKIIFNDDKNYVAAINNVIFFGNFAQDAISANLKGEILDDDIQMSFDSEKIDNKLSSDFILKLSKLNLLTKVHFIDYEESQNILNGNILIKKGKNKITGVFQYKDNDIIIQKSNLRNNFLDGKMEGKITLLPYFNYNLDISLNSINFTKLYNYFLSLDDDNKKKIFKINDKLNGNIILSADKIYSSYNLMKSFESNIKFNNGKILIEQFIMNLGKLGAADILGSIGNDKNFNNFKFESNIFVDNQKKFLSKFGIYNRENISSNLFVSGNFDFENLKMSFYEIYGESKLKDADVNYIENEFNDLMLTDGYKKLFYFPVFKEFIGSVSSESN